MHVGLLEVLGESLDLKRDEVREKIPHSDGGEVPGLTEAEWWHLIL